MSARNTFAATRRSHAIMKWLQNGEDVTILRVVENFGIKYPQAREDLKLLEELYLLETHRQGRTKVWRWAGFNPQYISVATAAALELGAIALDLFQNTPYFQEIERLAEHCRDRVGSPESKQRVRLERVSHALHLRRSWLPVDEEGMTEHTEMILDAVFLGKRLAMQYSRADGALRHYIVNPRKLVWYEGRLWLLADHETHTKLFDVAGIVSLDKLRAAPPAEKSEDPAAGEDSAAQANGEGSLVEDSEIDLDKYFETAFGIYAQNYPVADIHLEVRNSWANYLRRYRVHPSQRIEEDPETGGLHVHLRLGICPEFRSFVLGMIPDVRVHAPIDFVEEFDETIREWLDTKSAQGGLN